MIRIRPTAPNLLVLNPQTGRAIDAQGELVEPHIYWRRRLTEGSVELVPAQEQVSTTGTTRKRRVRTPE